MTQTIKATDEGKIRLDKAEFYELFTRVENIPGQKLLLAINTNKAVLDFELNISKSVLTATLGGYIFSHTKKANKFNHCLSFNINDLNEWYNKKQLEVLFKIIWLNCSGWFLDVDKKLMIN